MPPKPSARLYEMGRKHRESEEQPITELPAHLQQPESRKPIRPMGRTVSEDELRGGIQSVLDKNPWIACTHRNIDLITKVFLFDTERMSPQRNMEDLMNAVKIVEAEHRLDRTPPPPKEVFPDDDLSQTLADGTLPLPLDATVGEQRKASLVQMKNLVGRLKRQEVWQRQQDEKEESE
jgi:hypothetical protein